MNQRNGGLDQKARSKKHVARNLLAAALALALASVGGVAEAATQLVTNCTDHDPGSLRAAITAAMSGDVVDATGLACSTISLSTGALVVGVTNLTVSGAGREHLTVTNGAKYGRVFRHEGTGLINLRGMTIAGGVVSPLGSESGTRGGCIYSSGAVALGNFFDPTDRASGVDVRDCSAISTQAGIPAKGGGIFATTGLALANSTVTHSTVVAQGAATKSNGGGVAVSAGAFSMKYSEVTNCAANGPNGIGGGIDASFVDTVTVKHSTIAGNSATGRAGGAYLGSYTGGQVSIENSTISGNSSGGEGGLLLNVLSSATPSTIHVYSSTITANRSSSMISGAAGGASVGGDLILQSTIVSGNLRNGVNSDLFINGGRTVTGANNLIGVSLNAPPPASGLITATDPKLGPLTNRGGVTRTHEPLATSPAIDTGNNNSGSASDQRGTGFPRTLGAGTDIGAVERNPDTIFANGFD